MKAIAAECDDFKMTGYLVVVKARFQRQDSDLLGWIKGQNDGLGSGFYCVHYDVERSRSMIRVKSKVKRRLEGYRSRHNRDRESFCRFGFVNAGSRLGRNMAVDIIPSTHGNNSERARNAKQGPNLGAPPQGLRAALRLLRDALRVS
jgi:hypothetical protein